MPSWLKWLQWYPSYHAETFSLNFARFKCLYVQHLYVLKKIHKNCPCTVTENTKQPLKLHSLPGWHMTNTGLSSLFCKMLVLIPSFVWRLLIKKFNKLAPNAFQITKTSISLIQDFKGLIHCLSLGIWGNIQLKYAWNHAKWVRLPIKA